MNCYKIKAEFSFEIDAETEEDALGQAIERVVSDSHLLEDYFPKLTATMEYTHE